MKKESNNKEYQAMRDLYKNPDITIKPVDKGGSTVIMKTEDYIAEANRQLSNQEHYKTLDEVPTYSYDKYIHHLIDQAWRMGIKTTMENLQIKNLEYHLFISFLKYINPVMQCRQNL